MSAKPWASTPVERRSDGRHFLLYQGLNPAPARNESTITAITQIALIAAYALADGVAFGLDRPTLTVTFDDEAVADKQLVVGKRAGKEGYYVTGSESSFVLVASPEDVQRLLAAIEWAD